MVAIKDRIAQREAANDQRLAAAWAPVDRLWQAACRAANIHPSTATFAVFDPASEAFAAYTTAMLSYQAVLKEVSRRV